VTAVFSHGRLRLYLLKLLDEGPKHGYELIRRLEDRFLGRYTPSAGTIYPRLQRMEAEGLIIHTAAGGRKTYRITDAGRAELHDRADEVAELESDIQALVADLAALAGQIETGVRDSLRDLKLELREAAQQTRQRGLQPRGMTERALSEPSDVAAEFDRRLTEFLTEVRMLVLRTQPSQTQLRTAIRLLDGTLERLHRLLR
jgi:DNA-binding PadR family transcriptional regulator